MDDTLLASARAAAAAEGVSLSAWLSEAAADRLRLANLRRLVDRWEAQHGAFSADELAAEEVRIEAATRRAGRHRTSGTAPPRRRRAV